MRFDRIAKMAKGIAPCECENVIRAFVPDGKGNRSLFCACLIKHLRNNPLVVEVAALTKSVLDRQSPGVPAIDSCWTYVSGRLDTYLTEK